MIFFRWFSYGSKQDITLLHLSILSVKKFINSLENIYIYYNGKYPFEEFKNNFWSICNDLKNLNINFIDQHNIKDYFKFVPQGVWWKWVPLFSDFGDVQITLDNDLIFIKNPSFLYEWINSKSDFLAVEDSYRTRTTSCGSLGPYLRQSKHKLFNSGFTGIKSSCKNILENTLKRIAKEQHKQGNIHVPVDEQGAVNFSIMLLSNNNYMSPTILNKEKHESFWPPENLKQVEIIHFLSHHKTVMEENHDLIKDIILNSNIGETEQQLFYNMARKI